MSNEPISSREDRGNTRRPMIDPGEDSRSVEPPQRPSPNLVGRLEMILPGRAKCFLGRLILRICSSGRKQCDDETCQLRPLCRCAMDELESEAANEWKIWAILAACGGAVILYFFLRG